MTDAFKGQIFYGDNRTILKQPESGSIDLIYIDPPFNTGETFVEVASVRKRLGYNFAHLLWSL